MPQRPSGHRDLDLLLDDAGALLGHAVSATSAVDELRSLRVPATIPPELVHDLQRSLDQAGVAVADEDLSRDELMLLAEAWLAEADRSVDRERELRDEGRVHAGDLRSGRARDAGHDDGDQE